MTQKKPKATQAFLQAIKALDGTPQGTGMRNAKLAAVRDAIEEGITIAMEYADNAR